MSGTKTVPGKNHGARRSSGPDSSNRCVRIYLIGSGSKHIHNQRQLALFLRGGETACHAESWEDLRSTEEPAVGTVRFPASDVGEEGRLPRLSLGPPAIIRGPGVHGCGEGPLVDEPQESLPETGSADALTAARVSRMLFTPHLLALLWLGISIGCVLVTGSGLPTVCAVAGAAAAAGYRRRSNEFHEKALAVNCVVGWTRSYLKDIGQ